MWHTELRSSWQICPSLSYRHFSWSASFDGQLEELRASKKARARSPARGPLRVREPWQPCIEERSQRMDS